MPFKYHTFLVDEDDDLCKARPGSPPAFFSLPSPASPRVCGNCMPGIAASSARAAAAALQSSGPSREPLPQQQVRTEALAKVKHKKSVDKEVLKLKDKKSAEKQVFERHSENQELTMDNAVMASTGGSAETSAAAGTLPISSYAPHRQAKEFDIGDLNLLDAFRLFFAAVREASKDTSVGSIFQDIELTLRCLEPIIKEKGLSNLPKEKIGELMELLLKGMALVYKCTRRHLVYCSKHHYAKKLQKLQDNILRIVQINFHLQTCRDSKELLLEMKDLDLEMRRLNNFTEEKFRDMGKRTGCLESCKVPKEPNFMVGLDDSFHKLKGQLLKGGVLVLVVSAPEGFGKTTLVKKLGHDSDIEGKFKNILFIQVSKSPNFMMMVHKLIQFYRNGLNVPNIETEENAVYQLQQLLTQLGDSAVLLILDDVPSESESLLKKFVFKRIPDYKILVTSRFEFPSCGPAHQLSRLNQEDARKLFLQSAVPPLPDEDLAEKSVCGKHPSEWRTLLKLSEDPPFLDSGGEILDHLGRTARLERRVFSPIDCSPPPTTVARRRPRLQLAAHDCSPPTTGCHSAHDQTSLLPRPVATPLVRVSYRSAFPTPTIYLQHQSSRLTGVHPPPSLNIHHHSLRLPRLQLAADDYSPPTTGRHSSHNQMPLLERGSPIGQHFPPRPSTSSTNLLA